MKNQRLLKRFALAAVPACCLFSLQLEAQIKPNGSSAPASATPLTAPSSYSSGVKVNYVLTREAVAPITDAAVFDTANYIRVKQATQFLDALGRPLQTVIKQASPALKDMVSPVVYDSIGREHLKYLPYISTESNGSFKLSAFSSQSSFMGSEYSGESVYYGIAQYERSPLNRVIKTLAPGNSWAGNNIGVGMDYLMNAVSDSVRVWNIANDTLVFSNNDQSTDTAFTTATYAAGQLYKTQTTDENGNKVVEYKDKEGRVIFKKVQIASSPGTAHIGWLCTYYVYDDFGLLRFVIPPKAVQVLLNNSTWSFSTGSYSVINELCFRYQYDARKRMIAKKVPGAGWVYMVYDKRDRLSLTQDANIRSGNQWMATLYDDQNRPVSTGMISYSGNRGALQWLLDNNYDAASTTTVSLNFTAPDSLYVNTREDAKPVYRAITKIVFTGEFATETGAETETILSGAVVSTTNVLLNYNPFPPSSNFIGLTVNYYDDYSFTSKTYSTTNNSNIDDGGNGYPESLPSAASLLTHGMLTGTKVRAIENPSHLDSGIWMESASFYDDKGRAIQSQSENYKNGVDVTTMRYDFTNKVITSYQVHNNAVAAQTMKVKTNMLYDHSGRLQDVTKTLNDDATTTRYLARNTYDELRQLSQKQVGQKGYGVTTAMETLDNTYNIRGWLQGINESYSRGTGTRWFGMELNYDWGFQNTSQLNGNIAGVQWRSNGDGEKRAFGFNYDAANRILKGDFTQYTSSSWDNSAGLDFSLTSMSYDPNGNILNMSQKAWKITGSELIDSLLYNYNTNSNKLLNVIDVQNDTATKLGDFRSSKTYMTALSNSKTNSAVDYTYDDNGNLLKDRNKDIGNSATNGITYNHLNLPYKVWVAGKGTITYIYDAAGNKLEKLTVDSTISKTTKTSYLDGYIYQNDTLQFFAHEEGRIRKKPDNSFVYDYFIKDHLGNTRMVLTEEWQQDTYPVATLEDGATDVEGNYYNITTGNIVDKSTVTNFTSATGSGYKNNNGNPPYNSNPTSVVTNVSNKLYKLAGGSSNTTDKVGLGITLRVMSGDTVSIYGKSYWHNTGSSPTNTYSIPVNDLLALLAGTSVVSSAGKGATSGGLQGSSFIPTELGNWIADSVPTVSGKPKAYYNWVLFDEQFRLVSSSSGFHSVGSTSDAIDSFGLAVNITRNGYFYVYCSNESNTPVFFDNFQIIHNHGPLLEETHYYPFGLTMAGISSKAAGKLENRFKYNGKELQSKEFSDGSGLELYDYGARMQDPQIGRWNQIDPMSEQSRRFSPYTYGKDNPIRFVDPDGMKDVVFLNAKDGAGGNGHMASLIQDGKGNWYYVTMGAADGASVSKMSTSGTQGKMDVIPLNTKNMEEAITLAKQDNSNSEYTGNVVFKTDSKTDEKIFQNTKELQGKINSGETKYNLCTENCVDAVQEPVQKAGVPLPRDIDPRPNSYFEKLQDQKSEIQDRIDFKAGKTELKTMPMKLDGLPEKKILVPKVEPPKVQP